MSCSKKERHMSCYYTIVESDLIYMCMKGEADTWGRKSVPVRRRKPERMRSTKNGKRMQKRENRTYNLGMLEKREARTNVNTMC